MATNRSSKEQLQRLKIYRAHQVVNAHQVSRRRRDQWLAGAITVGAVAVAGFGYWGWAELGPGAPTQEEIAEAVDELVDDLEGEPLVQNDDVVPDVSISEFRPWDGQLSIDDVALEFELNGFLAPQAVANFIALANDGFYEGVSCHRLTTEGIFVLQCGDPEGTGQGGPGYTFGPIENAPEDDVYARGSLAMARVGGDGQSMGSQFFIVYDQSTIPSDDAGGYTVFGEVTGGLDDLIEQVIEPGTVGGVSDGEPSAPAQLSNITIR